MRAARQVLKDDGTFAVATAGQLQQVNKSRQGLKRSDSKPVLVPGAYKGPQGTVISGAAPAPHPGVVAPAPAG